MTEGRKSKGRRRTLTVPVDEVPDRGRPEWAGSEGSAESSTPDFTDLAFEEPSPPRPHDLANQTIRTSPPDLSEDFPVELDEPSSEEPIAQVRLDADEPEPPTRRRMAAKTIETTSPPFFEELMARSARLASPPEGTAPSEGPAGKAGKSIDISLEDIEIVAQEGAEAAPLPPPPPPLAAPKSSSTSLRVPPPPPSSSVEGAGEGEGGSDEAEESSGESDAVPESAYPVYEDTSVEVEVPLDSEEVSVASPARREAAPPDRPADGSAPGPDEEVAPGSPPAGADGEEPPSEADSTPTEPPEAEEPAVPGKERGFRVPPPPRLEPAAPEDDAPEEAPAVDVPPDSSAEAAAGPDDAAEPDEAHEADVRDGLAPETPADRALWTEPDDPSEPAPAESEAVRPRRREPPGAGVTGLDPSSVLVGVIQVVGQAKIVAMDRRGRPGIETPLEVPAASLRGLAPARQEEEPTGVQEADEDLAPAAGSPRAHGSAFLAFTPDEPDHAEELDPSELQEVRDSKPDHAAHSARIFEDPSEPSMELDVDEIDEEGAPRDEAKVKESVPPPPPHSGEVRPPSTRPSAPAPPAPPAAQTRSSLPDATFAPRGDMMGAPYRSPAPEARLAPSPSPALAEPTPFAPRRKRRGRKPWWEEIFDDDYLRSQPRYSERHTQKEVNFIQSAMGVQPGGVILDLACGNGRHAVEISSRGYQVVGLDLSLPMLARAAELAQRASQKINFIHGDMREMAFESTFDGVYCVGSSFGYFDDETNVQVIGGVHKALKARGVFVLEMVNRDYLINQQPNMVWFEGDGCVCMEESTFNFITSRLRVKRSLLFDDGRQVEHEFSFRAYCLHEIGQLLHAEGFRVTEVSGHLDTPGAFFGPDSPSLVILAEKRV